MPRFPTDTQHTNSPVPPSRFDSKPRGHTPDVFGLKRKQYRQRWLALLRANPGIKRSAARFKAPAVYEWLYKKDTKWLKANLPPKAPRALVRCTIDYAMRDSQEAALVAETAANIRSQPGQPLQITVRSICRQIGSVRLLDAKYLRKLPVTRQTLADVIETTEAFAVRRILWHANENSKAARFPSSRQFQREAGVTACKHLPSVKQALDAIFGNRI